MISSNVFEIWPRALPPNANFQQSAKLKYRQYFFLYGIHSYGGCIICSLTQHLAQTSLHQSMEVSRTTLQELVGVDHTTLRLPTVVPLATLLLVWILAPVNLAHGLVLYQLAKVSSGDFELEDL